MSRKTKRQNKNTVNQDMQQMPATSEITSTAKQGMDSVLGTLNNNKLLIGSIAGVSGAAIFLLGTRSGRSLRSGIQERAVDLYDFMSCQLSDGMDRVRDMWSGSADGSQHTSKRTRRVA